MLALRLASQALRRAGPGVGTGTTPKLSTLSIRASRPIPPLLRPRTPSRPFHHTTARPQSQYQRTQYQRFGRSSGSGSNTSFLGRWAARPTFYLEVAGLTGAAGGFYAFNLETVPVSGRRRFNIVSAEQETATAKQMYAQVMQQYRGAILPDGDARAVRVRRVLQRLIPASGLADDCKWEVHVIDEPNTFNAFVIPGGKVFVFTGILPVARTDDGLAAILGHEIAHNVAHHSAERMSQSFILVGLFYALQYFLLTSGINIDGFATQWLLDVAFSRPGSRKQESEADYIGLMMAAQSCFDPAEAPRVWERMLDAERRSGHGAPPQFLSSHPSSGNRMVQIEKWLPEAYQKRQDSDCGSTLDYANQFRKAFRPTVF